MPNFDDQKKFLLFQLANYFGLKGFLEVKWKEFWQEPLTFNSDLQFWQTLFADDYGEFLFRNQGRSVVLRHFKLTTWLPFVPGLEYKRSVVDNYIFNQRVLRRDDGHIIFDMHTKNDYVLNGYSSVRFDRIELDNEYYLILNAYTSTQSTLGIPVLVRARDINLHNLDDLQSRFTFEIHGILDYYTTNDKRFQFAPSSNKIPIIKAAFRLAMVETDSHTEETEASAWALVDVWDERVKKPYCIFSSFSVGNKDDRKRANGFLKDYFRREYNTSKYNIITDYDEISPELNSDFGIRDIGANESLFYKFIDLKKRYRL